MSTDKNIRNIKLTLENDYAKKVGEFKWNIFIHLNSFKRQIENEMQVDLYGRKLIFKFVDDKKS
jgi:hypothetical protein